MIYQEDGWVANVKVVKDNSTDREDHFTLKVLNTIRHDHYHESPPNGKVFKVMQAKDLGLWSLKV